MSWMKCIVMNVSKEVQFVGDRCAGTLTTANECMGRSRHWLLTQCRISLVCFNAFLPVSVAFIRQILNRELKITERSDVVKETWT